VLCLSDLQFQSFVAFSSFLFVMYFQLVEGVGHICGIKRGIAMRDVSRHGGRSFFPGKTAASLLLTYPEQS
jgi:hypothetical protein